MKTQTNRNQVQLPPEIVIVILSFIQHELDLHSIRQLSNVNHTWRYAVQCYQPNMIRCARSLTFGMIGASKSGKTSVLCRLLNDSGFLTLNKMENKGNLVVNDVGAVNGSVEESVEDGGDHKSLIQMFFDKTREEKLAQCTLHVRRKSIFMNEQDGMSFVDVPGADTQIKNCIRGIGQVNVAILVVSAVRKEFDQQLNQVSDMVRNAVVFGVDQFIVVVNKMDRIMSGASLQAFEQITTLVTKCLLSRVLKEKASQVSFIPCSATTGTNIYENRGELWWYPADKYPSLWQQINRCNRSMRCSTFEQAMTYCVTNFDPSLVPQDIVVNNSSKSNGNTQKIPQSTLTDFYQLTKEPFRMAVDKCYQIKKTGAVVCGIVMTGTVSVGKGIVIEPTGFTSKVASIQVFKRQVDTAYPGDYASIVFETSPLIFSNRHKRKSEVYAGCVISSRSNPEFEVSEFTARIVMVSNVKTKIVKIGWQPNVFSQCGYGECKVIGIESIFDKSDPSSTERKLSKPQTTASASATTTTSTTPDFLTTKNGGVVRFKALTPMCLTHMSKCPKMARVIFRDGYDQTVCVGYITNIDKYAVKIGQKELAQKRSSLLARQQQQQSSKHTQTTSKPVKSINQVKMLPPPFPRTKTTEKIWEKVTFEMDWWEETTDKKIFLSK